jgi:hypothetical protein
MNIDYNKCMYDNAEDTHSRDMLKPCYVAQQPFEWHSDRKTLIDNSILSRNLERPSGDNVQNNLLHTLSTDMRADDIRSTGPTGPTGPIEGFTNLGESYVEPGSCPDGYYYCDVAQKCIQVCQNCKFNEKKYHKSKEFNERDPCFPDGVYNGIDNQGNTMCTCGSKGQYCNDIFDAQGGMVTDGVYIVNVGDYFNVGDLAAY